MFRRIKYFKEFLRSNSRKLDEILWAEIFHDAINGCDWLKSNRVSLYPGRWAVGYNLLYVAFRYLNDFETQNCLEFGLGQSSLFIDNWFKWKEGIEFEHQRMHLVIEQDSDWADIYRQKNEVSKSFDIGVCKLDRSNTNSFYNKGDLKNCIRDYRFDLIIVDGPNDGGVLENGSWRSDIIELVPNVLCDDFCVIFDDVNNPKKIKTANKLIKKLSESGIETRHCIYKGETDVMIISSDKLKYMTTL